MSTRAWLRLGVPALVIAVAVIGSVWPTARSDRAPGVSMEREAAHPGFGPRSSHHRRYRARVTPGREGVALHRPQEWALEITTGDGRPVEGASLRVESWMPDSGRPGAVQPRVTSATANRYLVRDIVFDRRGWWNLKVEIRAGAGVDSLAFNVVV